MAEESNEPVDQALGGDDDAPKLSEVEQIASELGWRPKDQFSGDESLWRPAADFIRKMPGSRDLKREIRSLNERMEKMTAAHTRTLDRSLKEQREAIEAKFASAVENKDTAGAAKAVAEMRELDNESQATKRTDDPEARFAKENPWYNKDEEATAYAISVSQLYAKRGASVDDQLEAAAKAVKKRFPELFEDGEAAPAERKPATVASPSRGGNGAPRAKTYADLPPEAKKAADQFAEAAHMRFGKDPEASKKSYVADYFANVSAA